MIKKLTLKNIALIDYAEIDFTKGLNVLSGETGSGKSVIIDSINFVLGAKSDKTMIRFGESECNAFAIFDISNNSNVKQLLNEYEIEFDDELIIKRRLTIDGKSSIKVNGETVTSQMLRNITSNIVDVHGQSDHFSLLKQNKQLEIIDKFCGEKLEILKNELKPIIERLKELDEKQSSLGGDPHQREIRLDILKYQIDEIERAKLIQGEEEDLTLKKNKIKNSEKIITALTNTNIALSGENQSVDSVIRAYKNIQKIASLDEKYENLAKTLEQVMLDIEDVAENVKEVLREEDFDESEADYIDGRLDVIKSLKKKYGNNVSEILEFLENAKNEFNLLNSYDGILEDIKNEKAKLLLKLNDIYIKITNLRKDTSKDFCKYVVEELKELGMKNAQFEVAFTKVLDSSYHLNGNDNVEFMFSANKGEPIKSLSKIISGGEMSRFMLALKTKISKVLDISTYIFDEIDAGISGNIAQIVAQKFAKISKDTQILAISHLPQICAMSDNSLLIEKQESQEKTYTTVKNLSKEQKINEIIRLVGGTNDSEVAKLHAIELLKLADEYKKSVN